MGINDKDELMTTRTNVPALLGLFFLVTSGCVLDDVDIGAGFYAGHCQPHMCGNTNQGNPYPVSELNHDGLWSRDDFRIIDFRSADDMPLTVATFDQQFQIKEGLDWVPLGHGRYSELHINLMHDTGAGFASVQLKVEMPLYDVNSYVDNGVIPTYMISYWDTTTENFEPYCIDLDEFNILHITQAGITVGERYNPEKRTVAQTNTSRWFNIVCEGGALLKNKRLGYDPEIQMNGHQSTSKERQGAIRMMTASYCPDGPSYTELGQPLNWQNTYNWFTPPQGDIEAIWNEHGALCLDNPRRPDLWDNGCELPACDDIDLSEGMWWTTNP